MKDKNIKMIILSTSVLLVLMSVVVHELGHMFFLAFQSLLIAILISTVIGVVVQNKVKDKVSVLFYVWLLCFSYLVISNIYMMTLLNSLSYTVMILLAVIIMSVLIVLIPVLVLVGLPAKRYSMNKF